ncbi:Pyranose dehydrogenase 1-like protein 2 [Seiridium cupressi]
MLKSRLSAEINENMEDGINIESETKTSEFVRSPLRTSAMARLFSSLTVLFSAVAVTSAQYPTSTKSTNYLIVGGGPAGLVLAEQLSRSGKNQVTLLEAGQDTINNQLLQTPYTYPIGAVGNVWNYTAEPDPNLGGNAPNIFQGWGLGGGTAINGMAYCRGSASVFDDWAVASGNTGLAWKYLFQDFLEVSHYIETFDAQYGQFVNKSAYGNGPLEVSRTSGQTGFEAPFQKAVEAELGLHEVDMNDGDGIGLDRGISSIFAQNRTRSYSRNTFGVRAMARPNVKVITNAWVTKINFSGKTATGVNYQLNGKSVTLKADKVIVSGGAINTPKLLLLSGIGPQAQLSKLGIPVVQHSPDVGLNLRDHPFAVVELLVTPDIVTLWQLTSNTTAAAIAQQQYAESRSGPLGWNNGFVYATFRVPDSVFNGINGTHYTSMPADRPHVLIEFSGVPFVSAGNNSAVSTWASLIQPEFTGRVELKSNNYQDNPVITTNYYGTAADKAAIIYGYKKLRQVLGQDAIKVKTVEELYPGVSVDTDDEVWKAIQGQTFSFGHPVGTVGQGKVLNSDWTIKGLKNIRVVDSSTFPFPSSCHPQAVVYALANRAAKDILRDDK